MANTVVSIFRNPDQARQAKDHLLASGFSDKRVDIKIASYKSESLDGEKEEYEVSILERITDFFKDLFGEDDEEINQYAHAGSKGTILTVRTDTSEEAENVAGILDSFGALDAAETAGSYFPENEIPPIRHKFLDDPLHDSLDIPISNQEIENDKRVSRLKSRIIARSLEKTTPFGR